MKTADLIGALSRNLQPAPRGGRAPVLTAALGVAICVSGAMMVAWLGPRDLSQAVRTAPFWMKAIYTAALGLAGVALSVRLARPGTSGRGPLVAILAIVVVMTVIGAGQWAAAPPDARLALWLGRTWTSCPYKIVVLALPSLAALLWFMRRLAPTRPAAAGAAAGLAAGAIGATVYGMHCPETAAAFVATFYTLGVAISTGLGALVGSRLLRW